MLPLPLISAPVVDTVMYEIGNLHDQLVFLLFSTFDVTAMVTGVFKTICLIFFNINCVLRHIQTSDIDVASWPEVSHRMSVIFHHSVPYLQRSN